MMWCSLMRYAFHQHMHFVCTWIMTYMASECFYFESYNYPYFGEYYKIRVYLV